MLGFQALTLSRSDITEFLFLSVCEASHLHSVHIHNTQHLKQPIREAAASVTADVLGWVWKEMEYRLDVCRITNGAHINFDKHFENYLSYSLI
jgi:hypothetical protein